MRRTAVENLASERCVGDFVRAILFGVAACLVERDGEVLQKVPPAEQFNVAGDSMFSLLWTIGGIQILHGVIVIVCAAKGLKRARANQ